MQRDISSGHHAHVCFPNLSRVSTEFCSITQTCSDGIKVLQSSLFLFLLLCNSGKLFFVLFWFLNLMMSETQNMCFLSALRGHFSFQVSFAIKKRLRTKKNTIKLKDRKIKTEVEAVNSTYHSLFCALGSFSASLPLPAIPQLQGLFLLCFPK